MRNSRAALVAAGVGAAGALIYSPMLAPGWAPAGYDLVTYFYPLRHYLALAWAAGRPLPLWSPETFMGAPFLANIQTGVLYPPNLIFALLPTERAIAWLLILHLALAGAGMYLYARLGERLAAPAAAVTATVYMLGGFMDNQLGHLNQSNTLGWTPWLMLAASACARRPEPRRLALLGLVSGLIILAGHTQQAYFSFLLAAGVTLLRLYERRRLGWRPALLGGAAALGGVGLGAAVAAAQVLPTLELSTGASSRSGGLGLDQAGQFSLPIPAMLVSQLPDYLTQQPSEYSAYAGMAGLAIAAFAIAAAGRRPRVWILAAVAVLAIAVATGPHGKVYDLAFYALPGLKYFRVPARILLFSYVSLALLGGHGVTAATQLARARRRRRWRAHGLRALVATAAAMAVLVVLGSRLGTWIAVEGRTTVRPFPAPAANVEGWALSAAAACVALAVVLSSGRRARLATWSLAAVVAVELVAAGAPTEARHPLPALVYHYEGAGATLIQPDRNHRYLSLATAGYEAGLPAELDAYGLDPQRLAASVNDITAADYLQPDIGTGAGRYTVDGYDGGLLPIASYVRFRAPVLPPGASNESDYTIRLFDERVHSLQWLRDAGVAYVLTAEGQDPNPPGCRAGCLIEVAAAGHLRLWTFAGDLPTRAWVVDRSGRRVPATVVEDGGDRIRVTAPVAGKLWLSDAYMPGWKATIDGRPAAVGTDDGFRRVVAVPAGPADVVMTYQPRSVPIGIAISGAALVAVLALLLLPGARYRLAQ